MNAGFEGNVQPAVQVALKRLQIVKCKRGNGISGKFAFARRRRGGLERSSGEGARAAHTLERNLKVALMNDQRAGNKVAQTLLALCEKHGDDAEDVKRGQH